MPDEELKREFSRVPLSRTVRYRRPDTQTFHTALITNISLGGMFFKTEHPLAIGEPLYLQFMAETGDIVAEGYARVAHIVAGGVGVEFTKIDEKFIAYAQLVVSEELLRTRVRP